MKSVVRTFASLKKALRMCHRAGLLSIAISTALLTSNPNNLVACSFHVGLSGLTLSRQLAESVELVAMRPSAGNPFQFDPVRQLKGIPSERTMPPVVDDVTRQLLLQNPNQTALFARTYGGGWKQLLLIDDSNRGFVEEVALQSGAWDTSQGRADKRDYFAAQLNHPNAAIRFIALRELDAIDYAILRQGKYPLAVQSLLTDISDLRWTAYAPIRILLLGILGGEDAKAAIFTRLKGSAEANSAGHLGAWITAAIEAGGIDGLHQLEKIVLEPKVSLASQQLLEIVRAISVQSAGGKAELRQALDATIRRLVWQYPETAPIIPQVFGLASDWSQVSLVRELIAANKLATMTDLKLAATYLARARASEKPRQHPLFRARLPIRPTKSRP
jgi:hypothetical protein